MKFLNVRMAIAILLAGILGTVLGLSLGVALGQGEYFWASCYLAMALILLIQLLTSSE